MVTTARLTIRDGGLVMNNLLKIRKKQGLTLQQLGDICGKSKSTIHELQRQKYSPRLTTAYLIARALNVSVQDIWPDKTRVVSQRVTVRKVVIN